MFLLNFLVNIAFILSVHLSFVTVFWLQTSIRRSSSYLLGYLFKNNKLYLVDEAPNVLTTLIVVLGDSDSATVAVIPYK